MKRLKNCKLNGKYCIQEFKHIFNKEYPKFRKKFSSLIQQVNKLKIIIFVLICIMVIVIIVFLIYYFNTNKK
jgi:flagellar biosynthesis/type III secretory pathway M-ring protein FliF/YscJ